MTTFRYVVTPTQASWTVTNETSATFTWNYDEHSSKLLMLYENGKKKQWNSNERIDWSLELDPENPQEINDTMLPIYNTRTWRRMSEKNKVEVRNHQHAYSVSQFLHGEQGALLAAARLIQNMPTLDAKLFAASQAVDEARHVEVYSRLLRDKIGFGYPITPPLRSLLETVVTDQRWDVCCLGMQILIEGLALAAFQRIRDHSKNPLCASLNAYVMQDESRHVAFGRNSLKDIYSKMTASERSEREDFVIEACLLMRDRFTSSELWKNLGFPDDETKPVEQDSENMHLFHERMFTRVVGNIKHIGLWSPKVQKFFESIGAAQYADIDFEAISVDDQKSAETFDAKRYLEQQTQEENANSSQNAVRED